MKMIICLSIAAALLLFIIITIIDIIVLWCRRRRQATVKGQEADESRDNNDASTELDNMNNYDSYSRQLPDYTESHA